MIIDSHVHWLTTHYLENPGLYFSLPEAAAFFQRQVAPMMAQLNGGRVPLTEEYLGTMDEREISAAILLGVADTAEGCRRLNDELAGLMSARPGRVWGYACLPIRDPDAALEEMARAVTGLGLKGVKLYPSLSGLRLRSQEVRTVITGATHLGVPVLTDCSLVCWPDSPSGLGQSNRLLELLFSGWFRETGAARVVAAHLGGGILYFRDVLEMSDPGVAAAFRNLWFDVSPMFAAHMIRAAVESVGSDRLLFGSDFPFSNGRQILETIRGLGLSPDQTRAILGRNAAGLVDKEVTPR